MQSCARETWACVPVPLSQPLTWQSQTDVMDLPTEAEAALSDALWDHDLGKVLLTCNRRKIPRASESYMP